MAHIHTYHFRAMGSGLAIWLEHGNEVQAQQLLTEAEGMFAIAEQRLSRFRESSELNQLNRHQEEWFPVSTGLWQVVERAFALAEATNGLFDPTVLKALHASGYHNSFSKGGLIKGTIGQPAPGRFRQVCLDRDRRMVWLPAGVGLDLGGIGKGYTAQQVAAFLEPHGPCLIDAGGDIVAGRGPTASEGWPVAVALPDMGLTTAGDQYRLRLSRQTLATSATDFRRWHIEGEMMHHIIDPRTGRSAKTDVLSVTVLANSAAAAEAWATAALIPGIEEGFALLEDSGIAASLHGVLGDLYVTSALVPHIQLEPHMTQNLRQPLRHFALDSAR